MHLNRPFPVKYFLISWRALSDSASGIDHLEKYIQSSQFFLSDWKVIWIGTCALLRTSVDLFKVDARSCINHRLREEISSEWKSIGENKEEHPIFWEFLRKERNNIIHEYEWSAYKAWLEQDGTVRPAERLSLLSVRAQDVPTVLIMKGGYYKDRNSLDLLKESAQWIEARIFGAIGRAGFEPDELRTFLTFQPPAA
jgi:hypothetical protein